MRSGHHAILYWIFDQINHPIYFRDDVLCYSDERKDRERGTLIGGKQIPSVLNTYVYNAEDVPLDKIKDLRKARWYLDKLIDSLMKPEE